MPSNLQTSPRAVFDASTSIAGLHRRVCIRGRITLILQIVTSTIVSLVTYTIVTIDQQRAQGVTLPKEPAILRDEPLTS